MPIRSLMVFGLKGEHCIHLWENINSFRILLTNEYYLLFSEVSVITTINILSIVNIRLY